MAQIPVSHVVLLSGGIDSTTCLAIALKESVPNRVKAVSFRYGQKHSRELQAAHQIASKYKVQHVVFELNESLFQGGGSTLIDPDAITPDVTYEELEASRGISPTYVPFRNGNLLSAATAYALTLGASQENPIILSAGMHAEDAAFWSYPDCTFEFLGPLGAAIFVGSYQRVRLVTPLQWLTKAQVIQEASRLNAPLELTYSCYKGGQLSCGTCPTCRSRQLGFRRAGVKDPTQYDMPTLQV